MNEEQNGFSIDVQAETSSFSFSEETTTESSYTIMKDIPLPETVFFTPTEINIEKTVTPQTSTVGVNYNVKIDAEEAYNKAEQTEVMLNEVRGGMLDMYNEMKNSWLSNNNKDDFEERPTIEPTNLIFENRRDKMSSPPKWA